MSAGCIPIALAVGGPASIIQVSLEGEGRGGEGDGFFLSRGGEEGGMRAGQKGGFSVCVYSQSSSHLSAHNSSPRITKYY